MKRTNRIIVGVLLCALGTVASADVAITFERQDDGVTPLANGQDISTPPEFGNFITITSSGGLGAAIFDSSVPGPNVGGPDPDLLVNMGNVLMIQDPVSPAQTDLGPPFGMAFDVADDNASGGIILFDFSVAPAAPRLVSIDLVDINGNGHLTVTLTDTGGTQRIISVPDEWTGDIAVPPAPGFGTLDLASGVPQAAPFVGSPPTSVVTDPGFDITSIATLEINMNGSAAVDNLRFSLCDNVVCQAANPPCEAGEVCNSKTGLCDALPDAASGTGCDADGNLCTVDECNGSGACVSTGGHVTCQDAVPPCEAGEVCNQSTGMCDALPDAAAGVVCDGDGDLCSIDLCDGLGVCVSTGGNVACQDAVPPCEAGEVCNAFTGLCDPLPDAAIGTTCNADGDLCTLDECNDRGGCVSTGGSVACQDANPPCEAGEACNPSTGSCDPIPDPAAGTTCDADGNLCTIDLCDGSGACLSTGSDIPCQAASPPCEAGESCNPSTGACELLADPGSGTTCDTDGDLCTLEACDGSGGCASEGSVSCAPPASACDGGEACDPSTGACGPAPDAPIGTFCETDADACTAEACDGAGTCVVAGSACGACCLSDGGCQEITIADCLAMGNTHFQGAGSVCLGDNDNSGVDDACELPTLSQWSMLLLSVLLLGGLVRKFGRLSTSR